MSFYEDVNIANPIAAFGGVNVINETPKVQIKATYGFMDNVESFVSTTAGGTVDTTPAGFECSTGTTVGGFAVIRSKRPIIYRPGQGLLGRISTIFGTPAALSTQQAGMFSVQDSLSFGYDGLDFGILHKFGGAVEIQRLTVTGAAGGSENATVTVNGTGYTVPLTSGTVQHNAYEINVSLNSQIADWTFTQNDDTVEGLAQIDLDLVGAFTFSSATATGTWAELQAGNVSTENWTPQANWDAQPYSGFDPALNNVYQIDTQFLGYGNPAFYIANATTRAFEKVHTVKYLNTTTAETNLKNPSLNVGWVAASLGSTTDITMYGGSAALFTQGKDELLTTPKSISNTKTIGTSELSILTIRDRYIFGGAQSKAEIIPNALTVGNEGNKIAIIRLVKNAVLGNETNYQYVDEQFSVAEFDTAGTTVSNGAELGIIQVAPGGGIELNLREFLGDSALEPGDTLTISAIFLSGAAADIGVSINWLPNI